METIKPLVEAAHRRGAWVVVDNCYGEFTDTSEPGHWGADIVVGSLMKNPGGGLAPTGAYVAGQERLVGLVADMLYAPGLGLEVGPTSDFLRIFAQGLFIAPSIVAEALMGGAYVRALARQWGWMAEPADDWHPNDIVTAIRLGNPGHVERFCQAIQAASPIDSLARPEAWAMPGYQDPVIMAAGGFVAGASLELSCDAPMRPPYWVYLQGGLSRWHTILAGEEALWAVHPASGIPD